MGDTARAAKGGKFGSGMAVAASVGGEMILNVPGRTVRHTVFGLHLPWISFGGSIPITASVANQGNTLALLNDQRISADGQKVNLPSMLLLAGTSRTIQTVWLHPGIGWQTVSWENQTAHVLVIPGQLLLILLGLILLSAAHAATGARLGAEAATTRASSPT